MHDLMTVIIMFLSTVGPAIIIAFVGQAAVKSVGRNPSAAPKILFSMMMAFIFAEAIAIIALLLVYVLFKSK